MEIFKKVLFYFFFWVVLPCTRYRVSSACVVCSRSCVLYLTKSMNCVFSATLECTSHYLLYSSALFYALFFCFFSSLGYIRFVFFFSFFVGSACLSRHRVFSGIIYLLYLKNKRERKKERAESLRLGVDLSASH